MKKGKIILFISWVSAVALLVMITLTSEKRTNQFMGLTESKEQIINFTYPVQLKKLYVLPGQKVKKGEVLAELIRADIYGKINILDFQINELKSKSELNKNRLQTELSELEIKEKSGISKINDQIKQFTYKANQNLELISSLTGVKQSQSTQGTRLKLQSLKKEKQFIIERAQIKRENILYQLNNEHNPINDEINKLLEKKKFLFQDEIKLTVHAPIDGAIGSIRFNEKESIKAFETFMTMHDNYPTYVTGYIHENVVGHLEIGQEVEIEYVSEEYKSKIGVFEGNVKTIGSRIVNFPVRLKKYKIVPLWGYKVYIELPKNDLKLGQKVMISSELKKDPFDAKLSKILQFLKLK